MLLDKLRELDVQFNTKTKRRLSNWVTGRRCQILSITIAVSRNTRNPGIRQAPFPLPVPARIRFTSGWVGLRWRPSHVYPHEHLLAGKWPILIFAALTVALPFLIGSFWPAGNPYRHCGAAVAVYDFVFSAIPIERGQRTRRPSFRRRTARLWRLRTVHEPYFLNGEATMVAIFLSVFDVHVQRAPIEGEIKFVRYNKGKFLDARNMNASLENENRVVGLVAAGRVSRDGAADRRADCAAHRGLGGQGRETDPGRAVRDDSGSVPAWNCSCRRA